MTASPGTESVDQSVGHSAITSQRTGGIGRVLGWAVAVALAAACAVWGLNEIMLDHPVSQALASDGRNTAFQLSAHYGSYMNPGTLVLDLGRSDRAAPIDLMRGLFISAKALHDEGRTFNTVTLSHGGKPVMQMDGAAFGQLGTDYEQGENTMYLLRTLPEKLFRMDGTRAFGTWEGGIFGVFTHEMNDATEAMAAWSEGRNPVASEQ